MPFPDLSYINWFYGSNPVIPNGGIPGTWNEITYEQGNVIYEPWDIGKEFKHIYGGHPATGWNVHGTEKLGYCYSSDGENWTIPTRIITITDGLEDPYLTIKINGLYYLYAELKPVGGPQVSIVCYTSPDLITWTYRGEVLYAGTGWEAYSVSSPVVWYEGGTFYMLYEGRYYEELEDLDDFGIGLATSSDGFTWTKEASNPVIPYTQIGWGTGVVPDDIIKMDGVYYLSIHTYNPAWPSDQWRGGLFKSTDLLNWVDVYETFLECPEGYPHLQMTLVDSLVYIYYIWGRYEAIYLGYGDLDLDTDAVQFYCHRT